MNAAEKKVVRIAIFLFAVGTLVRFAPWGLPAIENVDIADRQKYAQTSKVSGVAQSRLEYAGESAPDMPAVAESAGDPQAKSPPKRGKKKKAVVRFPLRINDATADELWGRPQARRQDYRLPGGERTLRRAVLPAKSTRNR